MRLAPIFLCGSFVVLGCDASTTDPLTTPSAATQLVVVSGQGQSQLAGYPLADEIVLEARDASGRPVAGEPVEISGLAPSAEVFTDTNITNATGRFTLRWRLAARLGDQELQARLPSRPEVPLTRISATATGSAVRAISGDAALGMCAVYLDGRLGCWKVDENPPLVPPTATLADGPERYRDVAMLWDRSSEAKQGCAVTDTGRVRCFDLVGPDATPGAWVDIGGTHPPFVQMVSRGFTPAHCAIDASGDVWCWGNNSGGLVGDGTTIAAATPTRLAIPAPVTEVALETNVGCALTVTGEVYCWGKFWRDRLEDTTGTGPSRLVTALRFSSIDVFDVNALCGITSAQLVYCWGNGSPQSLRQGGAVGPSANPLLSYTGARSLIGQRELTFVTTPDGVGAWWGDIEMLHTPSDQRATMPRPPQYPLGFTTLIQHEEATTICGRNAPTDPAICFRTEMFFGFPTHVVDPKLVIGFGVPGP